MTMYYLLTATFKEQEKILADMILKIAPVEQIYMLGSTLSQRRTESIFLTDAPSFRQVVHYYLLVLAGKDVKYGNNDLQDRIENNCRSFIPVTAIVITIEQFRNWLDESHAFVLTVCHKAVLLHGAKNLQFPEEKKYQQAEPRQNKDSWTAEYNRVNEFIEGAKLFILRQQNKMAIFMLHQATEHALRAIFKRESGLHINTHNLDKLFRYCTMISHQIPDIFNRMNEKEERCFQLLQKGYIETRYKEDFTVAKNDLEIVFEKIKKLQNIMRNLPKN